MSNGRFILAVGLGAYREEFEAWVGNRYPKAHRGEMLEEGLAAFQSLITEKISSFDGQILLVQRPPRCPRSQSRILSRSISVDTIWRRSSAPPRSATAGCRAGGRFTRSRSGFRSCTACRSARPRSKEIEVAPQFSLLIGKTEEAAEKTYMQSGLVAHRKSLAYTGRDPAHQVTGNLVGSPQPIIDKIHELKAMGVDHCSAMAIAVNSEQEYIEEYSLVRGRDHAALSLTAYPCFDRIIERLPNVAALPGRLRRLQRISIRWRTGAGRLREAQAACHNDKSLHRPPRKRPLRCSPSFLR